jgi:hypothetical protein
MPLLPRGVLLVACFGVLVPSCKSDEPPDFADPNVPPVETNADGDPYPTDHLGGNPRRGGTRGDRIPNFAFQAYRDGNRAAGLSPISLSEFFDPKQKKHKILHLQVAATWCTICSSELEATVSVKDPLLERGVVFFEVVVAGASFARGPALSEVDEWIDRHKTNFSTGIDVQARRLGGIGVSTTAMPHDIMIDTRTMEILDSSIGAPLDVAKYVGDGLRWVNEHPPSY